MSQTEVGILGMIVLIVLILTGTHIGFAMILVGVIGFGMIGGFPAAIKGAAILSFDKMNNYDFSVLPLFLLMGALVSQGGIGRQAYEAARTWLGQFRGGLAMATIGACGLFAAACGSSLAGSLVMGKVAYPEMRKAGYDEALAAGTISTGGTLGILIPPSMAFILLGILAELSIGKLFMAGLIPGIMVVILYILTIVIQTKINPKLAPTLPKTTWRDKAVSVRLTWPIILLFLLVIGGIYTGTFTATEAGAIGAFGALLISLVKRQMTGKGFWEALMDAARMTAMIIIILIGAYVFNAFLAITQIPFTLSEFVVNLPVSRWIVYILLLLFYLVAGCFFDIYAIIILTVPVIYPTIRALGFDLIWYSVIMVRIMEIGMVTPPFGINLFGILGVIDAPLSKIYRGVMPFLVADLLSIVILSFFPVIATFLPYNMF